MHHSVLRLRVVVGKRQVDKFWVTTTTTRTIDSHKKDAPEKLPSLGFSAAVVCKPHPEKAHRGGEDAFFVAANGQGMGVFDGVGSWAEVGVDPSAYARSLAKECNTRLFATGSTDPTDLLQYAFLNSASLRGSSTACVATLDNLGVFRATTVGDSVFFVIRNGSIFFRQKELQHGFNYPFQLGENSTDTPESGAKVTLELKEGDIVIMCTDGVTDNLFDEELLGSVEMGGSHQEMAQHIAESASRRAKSRGATTPFSKTANTHGFQHVGGKLDDITVIVAFVTENKSEK